MGETILAVALVMAWFVAQEAIVATLERLGVPNPRHGLLKAVVVVVCAVGMVAFARIGSASYVAFFGALPTVIVFRVWLRHLERRRGRVEGRGGSRASGLP